MKPATTAGVLVGEDGKIVATGDVALRGATGRTGIPACPGIEEIRLGSRVACPGFIDAHAHLENLARELMDLALGDVRSLDDLLSAVAKAAEKLPRERVLFGSGWDESTWATPGLPTPALLDKAAPGRAVVLRRVCGHLWAVNSEALRRIGEREDLAAHERERLWAVSSNGLLREDDIELARPLVEPASDARRDGLLAAMRHALALGITCVHDVGNVGDLLREMEREEPLPVRVVAGVLRAEEWGKGAIGAEGRVHPGPLKLFLDGSIGARTAAVSEPYADEPGNRGVLLRDEGELAVELLPHHERGVQMAIHAIGDRAVDGALSLFERLNERRSVAELRHRIEHAEMITDAAIARMVKLGVIASMQPNFVGRWQLPGGLYEQRLAERAKLLNPFRKVLAAGVPIAFGSDCMPMGPLFGIRSAMNHPLESERLTFLEALHAYTLAAAVAGRVEQVTGSIEPGKCADIVILSADPASGDARVEQVFIKGRNANEIHRERS
jgi:predicted amidohydrolase YtcJ